LLSWGISCTSTLASELDWGERRYSPRTLEGWLYEWRVQGFGALERQSRRDKGIWRVISPQASEAIVKLRLLPRLQMGINRALISRLGFALALSRLEPARIP
jgi:hypothetical protein